MVSRARTRHAAGQGKAKRPEAVFQAQVIELATLNGWRHYHPFNSEKSVPGFPDLTLVNGSRLVFAELKAAGGRVSPEQRAWWLALTTVSQAVTEAARGYATAYEGRTPTPVIERHDLPVVGAFIWTPADWPEIEDTLRRRT